MVDIPEITVKVIPLKHCIDDRVLREGYTTTTQPTTEIIKKKLLCIC